MKNSNSENIGYLNHRRDKLVDKKNNMISNIRNTKPHANRKRDKFNKRIEKKVDEISLLSDRIHKEIRLRKKDDTWENQVDSML